MDRASIEREIRNNNFMIDFIIHLYGDAKQLCNFSKCDCIKLFKATADKCSPKGFEEAVTYWFLLNHMEKPYVGLIDKLFDCERSPDINRRGLQILILEMFVQILKEFKGLFESPLMTCKEKQNFYSARTKLFGFLEELSYDTRRSGDLSVESLIASTQESLSLQLPESSTI